MSVLQLLQDFTTVDASKIKHELLERESETPPLPLLHSSDGKSAIVHAGKIEDEVLTKADKFECMESGEATLLSEEAESSKDLEGKESITCDGTEITSSKEEQNLSISQEAEDDQVEEKVPDVAGEASVRILFTTSVHFPLIKGTDVLFHYCCRISLQLFQIIPLKEIYWSKLMHHK